MNKTDSCEDEQSLDTNDSEALRTDTRSPSTPLTWDEWFEAENCSLEFMVSRDQS